MAQAALKQDPPSAGHNLELTEAEKRSLLVNGLRQIEHLIEKKDAVVKDIRTARKRLVSHGFKPKVIDFALRLRNGDDDAEIEQRRAEIEVARFLNHPIGTQPELPLDMTDRTPGVDKAFAEGEIAGAEGLTCSAPYVAGSPNEQAWIKGWHEGQTSITSAFQKLEAKASAEAEVSDESEEADEVA